MPDITLYNSQAGVIGDHAYVEGGIQFTTYQYTPPQPVDEDTLAAAQEHLTTLPLDTIPSPDFLPQGSRVIFSRNPLFVGREADLKALAGALKGETTTAVGQVAAATGLGGIGKTQLASEFVHRYGQFFTGGVFWLNFADPQAVPAEIAACGGAGSLELRPDFSTLPLDDQVRLVLGAWQSPLPRLLVFDNCEDEALLARWRPPSGGTRVLVTSRRGEWNAELGMQVWCLDVLEREESVALLRKHRSDLTDAPADAIAEELGDLPLALHMAGSFLAASRRTSFGTPEAYLEQLRGAGLAHPSLAEDGRTFVTDHERHVARTFALSYERLAPQDPVDAVAQALLARSAYFAPGEPIPRALLLATLISPEKNEDDFEIGDRASDALTRLVELGLLDADVEGGLVLHRLLAAFVRGVTADDTAQISVEEALSAEARRLNSAGYPAPLLTWQSHLRAVTDAAQARQDNRAAGLCNSLGYHLQMIGDYPGARPYYERALAICEKTLGPSHPYTAISLISLGVLLKDMGDLAEARPYLERGVAIAEKTLGPDHPDTATSLNHLGVLLKNMGDLAEARPYYERALAIYEKALGPNHPGTAQSLNNLGELLQAMGDLAGARPYLERALTIKEKTLGPDHPGTAQSINNLGLLLYSMGDLARAQPYFEQALAIYEKTLGPNHPNTATPLNNLGKLLQAMGDLAGARPYYERALAIYEKTQSPAHPYTATNLNNLGSLLQAMGDLAGARLYYERALAICEKTLGLDHPYTANSLSSLGMLLKYMGDLAGARPYLERAMAICEKTLGPNHPDTAGSLNNLGALLQDMGDLTEARPYYERALAICEKALGPDHPYTATSLGSLGMLLQDMGDLAEARPYYERALAIKEKTLGPNHPYTAASLNNLGGLLHRMGDLAGAQPYMERALTIAEETLGPNHPSTAFGLNNLGLLLYSMGDLARARPYLQRALAIMEKALGHEHPRTQTARRNLAKLDEKLQEAQ